MSRAAFGYCRVSSPGQKADDRDGIPRQKEAIKKYAAANGLHVARWFVDAIPGKTDLEHRPALQELIAAANGIKVIVIEKVERLARDLMVQENIIADLQKSGFELLSTMEPDLCSADPTRVLIRQVLGAVAQYDRAMLEYKLKGARERARKSKPDYKEGRKRFGHLAGEPETITRILELRNAGKTLQAICDILMEEKRPTRKPKKGGKMVWRPTQLQNILKRAGLK